jgi:hypothetical protein
MRKATKVSGTFATRIVGDNLVEYTANVHAKNALAWCVVGQDDEGDWDGVTMLFGAHVYDVLDGAEPAVGECHFKISRRQAADEPIADVNLAADYHDEDCDCFPDRPTGFVITDIDFRGTAFGPPREESALGEDGASGKLVISQTGSNSNSGGQGKGNLDWFPAEVVSLHAVASCARLPGASGRPYASLVVTHRTR